MISRLAALAFATFTLVQTARTLDIYFIDVEGGQSTLVVAPSGQSLLVDTGFPGRDGTFQSQAGDAHQARDANRIAAAVRDAGLERIDFLLITHFHADHDGGAPELAALVPIGTFIDHGTVPAEAEQTSRGTLAAFQRYAAVREKGRHLEPKPGDRLPLNGVDATVVSAAGATLTKALDGAGTANPSCSTPRPPQEPHENPRSTGIVLQFGRFRFIDLGDLTGPPLYALFCPNDLLGPADVYLLPHHGGLDTADPAVIGAVPPRAAMINNGAVKGGASDTFAVLHGVRGIGDVWQLHRSRNEGAQNFADEHIANLDETTSYWIKVTAKEDGSFVVSNARTKVSKRYERRGK
jgi:beta-lactamase superfamily II metal-dependent hydrolase